MLTEEDKNLQWVLYTDFNEAEKKNSFSFSIYAENFKTVNDLLSGTIV